MFLFLCHLSATPHAKFPPPLPVLEIEAAALCQSDLDSPGASLVAQMVKNLSATVGDMGSILGKVPWRRAWQPTPVFLPGESPWSEEPVKLQSMGLQRVGHD